MGIEAVSLVDEQMWNSFVASHPGANIFHTRQFFDGFRGSEKHLPHAFALLEDNSPVALLVALQTRVLGARFEKYSSRSVVLGGVLSAPGTEARYLERHLGTLLQHVDRSLRDRVLFSEIRNVDDASSLILPCAEEKHDFQPHLNYLFDLDAGADFLWERFSPALRRAITRAKKKGMEVVEAATASDIDEFSMLVRETYTRVHIPVFDNEIFQRMWQNLSSENLIRVTLAKVEGRCVAARAALVYKGKVFDWFAGSNAEGYQLNANAFLAWDMISWGCRNDQAVFDFGGAGDPRKPYSVRDFKRRFHGRVVNHGRFVKIYSPVRYALSDRIYRGLKRVLF